MNFSIILDFIVILFLMGTLGYAVSLNKKLARLYQSRGDLQTFIESFTKSLGRAEASMEKLKASGEQTFSGLQEGIASGNNLKEDLAFLVDRSETVASKLEELVREGRALQKDPIVKESKSKKSPLVPEKDSEEDSSESALLKSLRNVR
ncbi:MAG: DUF6468 domain-containing protein [Alphaproteobacteria bacterium]|jgi:hypothetical protein|nr:DUF6468 domain-containing protein [Alphaproteobacteria bacterium]